MGHFPGFPLACTVRGCGRPLGVDRGALRCAAGHAFDRAREGYWNLIQPQDRRSARPGDGPAAVAARRRWLLAGFASGLVEEMRAILGWSVHSPAPAASIHPEAPLEPPPADFESAPRAGRKGSADGGLPIAARTILDIGCGEGTLLDALCRDPADASVCGLDLSARAIALAARSYSSITWVVANADRSLPVLDGSINLALSLFGRRPASEIARALQPGGRLLVAVPGDDDLVELRALVLGAGVSAPRLPALLDELTAGGTLRSVDHRLWRQQVELSPDSLRDLLAITYRGQRRSQSARAASISRLTVTLSADLLMLERAPE